MYWVIAQVEVPADKVLVNCKEEWALIRRKVSKANNP